jgi:predicted SAM-dependent methyltransferase
MAKTKTQLSRTATIWARIGITLAAVAFLAVLRYDVTAMLWREANIFVNIRLAGYRTASQVEDYLRANPVRKLQIGAGDNNKPGWLNSDIEPIRNQIFLDATKRFPIPDATIHYIYSEHVIEHIGYEEGLSMLRESYRVLAPGGKVRVATPNLNKFLSLFNEQRTPEMESYIVDKTAWHQWPSTPDPSCYILNQQLREWGHRFVYTPRMLRASLEAAGFQNIRELTAGESDDPVFRGIEMRSFSSVGDINRFEALVFEATRPPAPATTALNR